MKNLFLKIACVLVALVTWLLVAATTMVEEDLRLPMVVVGLGEGMTVEGSTLPDMAAVRLRASKLSVMAHRYLGVSLGQVQLNLTDAVPGAPRLFELKEADVRTEAEVVSLLPPVRLPLRLDWLDTRRLPVRVPLQGQLPADHMLGGPVTVLPDSVDVTGPRRFFAGLDSLVTEPVDLASLQQSLVKDLPLVRPPAPLEAKATSVAVTVPVVKLSERILANIPVIALAESHLGETGVSPPVCDVLVRGPADSVIALSPARLTVTVALAGLGPGVHQVPGFAQHPDWVTSVQLEPALFMVIIGEAPDAEEGP